MVVVQTDKSGKFSVMSQEDYLTAGDLHVVDDQVIDEKQLRKVERRLNATCSLFIKMFRVGEGAKHVGRHRGNAITHSANPSRMKVLHKDHKGPGTVKMRRINGPGLNIHISNFISEILENLASY